jgi:FkbM family methyltransferase
MSRIADSWTASLYRDTKRYLRAASFFPYRNFLLQSENQPDGLLRLGLKPPVSRSVYLRRRGSDILTFAEVIDRDIYRPVIDSLPSCDNMIDLGANIGLATLYLGSRYKCPCFCLEPNPDTFRILTMNLSGMRAQLCQAGVWSAQTLLSAKCLDEQYSGSKVVPDGGGSIPGLPMKEVIRRSGFTTIGLLKVDIEGAETELFKGDVSWLDATRAIAIEFHGDSRRDMDFDRIVLARDFRVIEGGHTTVAIRLH